MLVTLVVGAVHVAPWVTAPLGAVVGLALGWLWWWQGRDGVPPSRRRIRRASLLLGLVLVPMLVAGLSFVDPSVDPRRYAEIWSLVLVLLGLIVATAVIDAVNSLRVHALEQRAESRGEADALVKSVVHRMQRRRTPGGAGRTDRTDHRNAAEEDRGAGSD